MIDYLKAAVGRISATGEPLGALPFFIFTKSKQQYWFVTSAKDRDGDRWVEARDKSRLIPEPRREKTDYQFQLVSDADHPNQVAIYSVGYRGYLFVSSQTKGDDHTLQVQPPRPPGPRSWFALEEVAGGLARFKSTAYNDRWLFSSADDDSGDDYVEAHGQSKLDGRENLLLLPVGLETTVVAETPKYGSFAEVPSTVDVLITDSVRNDGRTPVIRKIELTKSHTTSFTWKFSERFHFGAKATVSGSIPGIGKATGEEEWSIDFEAEQSHTSTVQVTYGVSEEIQVAPFTEKHGTGTLKWSGASRRLSP